MDIKFILILVAIIGVVWWVSDNKPATYDAGKDTASDWGSKIIDWVDDKLFGNEPPADDTTDDEPAKVDDKVSYGNPYMPFECSSDVQCRTWFTDIDGIQCDTVTGECYVEVI